MPPVARQITTYTVSAWQIVSQRTKGVVSTHSVYDWVVVYTGLDKAKADAEYKLARKKTRAKIDSKVTNA